MTDSEGAPIAGTSGPRLRYVPAIVACCPHCCGDLQEEGGGGYWCPACQIPFSFAEVGFIDEGDYERD